MNIDHFFKNWGIDQNPFRAEEARDDELYQRIMGDEMTHPEFEKIMGTFERPGTAVVFGEKGSGKTAIRLLMEERIRRHNAAHPEHMAWVVPYDDLNPFLDHLARHGSQTRHGKPADFPVIRLADHQVDDRLALAAQLVRTVCRRGAGRRLDAADAFGDAGLAHGLVLGYGNAITVGLSPLQGQDEIGLPG